MISENEQMVAIENGKGNEKRMEAFVVERKREIDTGLSVQTKELSAMDVTGMGGCERMEKDGMDMNGFKKFPINMSKINK